MKADPLLTYSDMKLLPLSQQRSIGEKQLRHSLNQVAKNIGLTKHYLGWTVQDLLCLAQMCSKYVAISCLFLGRELLQKVRMAFFDPPSSSTQRPPDEPPFLGAENAIYCICPCQKPSGAKPEGGRLDWAC